MDSLLYPQGTLRVYNSQTAVSDCPGGGPPPPHRAANGYLLTPVPRDGLALVPMREPLKAPWHHCIRSNWLADSRRIDDIKTDFAQLSNYKLFA